MFEDTKGLITIVKSKDRQCNDQKKRRGKNYTKFCIENQNIEQHEFHKTECE